MAMAMEAVTSLRLMAASAPKMPTVASALPLLERHDAGDADTEQGSCA